MHNNLSVFAISSIVLLRKHRLVNGAVMMVAHVIELGWENLEISKWQ